MSATKRLTFLGPAALLSACAINPVPVSALPGANKDQVTFTKDETFCRTEASKAAYQAGPQPRASNVNVVWQAFFTRYGQCEASRGNLVQPVPWGVAYQLYLGYGLPYPGGYPPPPPYGYP